MQWPQKTHFIRTTVKRQPVKSKKSDHFPIMPLVKREYNHTYSLFDNRGAQQSVCRDFFLNCLQVTPNRVHNALNSITKNPSATENRGKAAPSNKTSEADRNIVRLFIESIPKYESHYGRADSQRKYLHFTLTIRKLYNKYKEERAFKNMKFVSYHIFRRIFKSDFNLSFKLRHTDTCRFCDEINISLRNKMVPENTKNKMRRKLLSHKDLVMKTHARYAMDVKTA